MALEGRDLNDSSILQATVQETGENGTVRYSTTLPSGRLLTSEWMNPDSMQGKTVISWCNHVREQINVDVQEERAAKKREAPTEEEVFPKEDQLPDPAVGEEEDPLAYVTRMRDAYMKRVEVLEDRELTVELELKAMRKHLDEWNKVLHTLRGETDE